MRDFLDSVRAFQLATIRVMGFAMILFAARYAVTKAGEDAAQPIR